MVTSLPSLDEGDHMSDNVNYTADVTGWEVILTLPPTSVAAFRASIGVEYSERTEPSFIT